MLKCKSAFYRVDVPPCPVDFRYFGLSIDSLFHGDQPDDENERGSSSLSLLGDAGLR